VLRNNDRRRKIGWQRPGQTLQRIDPAGGSTDDYNDLFLRGYSFAHRWLYF
jgi:hypothetical protein